jgi:hypothetical protein
MAWPCLQTVSLEGGVDRALDELPDEPGVAQLLAEGGRNLLIGRGASIRSWTAARLGRGPRPKPGQRPPLDLTPVAVAVLHARTFTEFGQVLAFERLMGRYVPLEARPDLKPPWWIHLDPEAAFPRLSPTSSPLAPGRHFGPFRSRAAAQDVIDRLHGVVPLRPCDFTFEPRPDLALGLGCVFAQVGTCAAPCLERISADDYRALSRDAQQRLAAGDDEALGLAPFVGDRDAAAVVAEARGDGTFELYPVVGGEVLEDELRLAHAQEAAEPWPLAPAFSEPGIELQPLQQRGSATPAPPRPTPAPPRSTPAPPRVDWPWLSAWLHGRKRRGAWLRPGPAMLR